MSLSHSYHKKIENGSTLQNYVKKVTVPIFIIILLGLLLITITPVHAEDITGFYGFNPTGGIKITHEKNSYDAWPDISINESGAMFIVYRATDTSKHVYEASGRIAMNISYDGGSTWLPAITIIDNAVLDDRDPVLLIFDDSGVETMLICYFTLDADGSTSLAYSTKSADGGHTWSAPVSIGESGDRRVGCHPILLSNGDILLTLDSSSAYPCNVYAEISEDGGDSWAEYALSSYTDGSETTVLEVKTNGAYEGKIIAIIRQDQSPYGFYEAVSYDYGRTWAGLGQSSIFVEAGDTTYAKGSKPVLYRWDSDTILFAQSKWNYVNVWVSSDEGSTWPSNYSILSGRAYSYYPNFQRISNTCIAMVWCENADVVYGSDVFLNFYLTEKPTSYVTNGLVGRFTASNSNDTMMFDESNTHNNATIVGGTRTAMESGEYYIKLDGDNDYITIPNNAAYVFNNNITVNVLYKPDTATKTAYLLNRYRSGTFPLLDYYYNAGSPGSSAIEFGDTSAWASHLVYTSGVLNTSLPYYITGSYAQNNVYKIFINANLVKNSTTPITNGITDNGQPFLIGKESGSAFTNGRIYEVSIYNRQLTPYENLQNYYYSEEIFLYPTYTIAASSTTIKEADTSITLTVTKDISTNATTTVNLSAINGTASNGVDFLITSPQVLTFAPGETSKTAVLSIKYAPYTNLSSKSFMVELSNPTGNATLGEPHNLTIVLNYTGAQSSNRETKSSIITLIIIVILSIAAMIIGAGAMIKDAIEKGKMQEALYYSIGLIVFLMVIGLIFGDQISIMIKTFGI